MTAVVDLLIDEIQNNIFKFEDEKLHSNFIKLNDELAGIINIIPYERREMLNQVLELLFAAYRNKDYLLLADILRYELLYAVNGADGEGGIN